MANETEVIREQMEATRTDLSDKLEKLEDKVMHSVTDATSAVAETVQNATATVNEAVQSAKDVVESVKESVEGTVDSVRGTVESVTGAVGGAADSVRQTFQGAADSMKETFRGAAESVRHTFDLPRQVDRHPWLMVGGAVAVGFVAGKMFTHAPAATRTLGNVAGSFGSTTERFARSTAGAASSAAEALGTAASAAGGLMSTLESMFGPEISKLKEMAIGAALGMARDATVQAVPPTMSRQVADIFDSFTSKLGGKPVEGAVIPPRPPEEETADGPGRRF